jgi:transposase
MNEVSGKVIRRKFSPEFKDRALERAERDGVAQAAKDLEIDTSMLYSWRSQRRQRSAPFERHKLEQAELAKLKREVARLAEENAFLKKAAAYFAKGQP